MLLPRLLFLLVTAAALGQDVTPGGIATAPRTEAALEGLTRRDPDTLALTLAPGKTLLLHDFDFNGDPVSTDKLHLRQLSPGVFEITSLAYTTGFWRVHITDAASIFGLGEHTDTLDHAHTILRNLAIALPADTPRGSTSPRPAPFFLSTTGYGLWLDTGGDATFDLNASDPANIVIDADTSRLRLVLFTGKPDNPGRFPDLLLAYASFNPSSSKPAALPKDGAAALTAGLSDTLSGLPAAGPAMRPLVLDFQDDPQARGVRDEYLSSPETLVAPALDRNPTRVVYLPAGTWYPASGDPVTGPATIVAPAGTYALKGPPAVPTQP